MWPSTVEADIHRGLWVDPVAGKTTFKEYAESWRAVQVHRPRTVQQIESTFRLHVYPRIGHRPLAAIRASEIQGLVKAMPLAPSTVAVVYSWLSTVFKAAIADKVLTSSPCRGVRLPDVHQRKVVPLPVDTVEKLAETVLPATGR